MKGERQLHIYNMRLKQMLEELSFIPPSNVFVEKDYSRWESERHQYLSRLLLNDMHERTVMLETMIFSRKGFVFNSDVLCERTYDEVVKVINDSKESLDANTQQNADELLESFDRLLKVDVQEDVVTWQANYPSTVSDPTGVYYQQTEPLNLPLVFNFDTENIPERCRELVDEVFADTFTYEGLSYRTLNQLAYLRGNIDLTKPASVGVFFLVCRDLQTFKSAPTYPDFVNALIGLALINADKDVKKVAGGIQKKVADTILAKSLKDFSKNDREKYNLMLTRMIESH